MDFPGGLDSKESVCNARGPGSVSGWGRSSGEGNGYSLQYSCLENSMNREAWCATSSWSCKELDTTERLTCSFFPSLDQLRSRTSQLDRWSRLLALFSLKARLQGRCDLWPWWSLCCLTLSHTCPCGSSLGASSLCPTIKVKSLALWRRGAKGERQPRPRLEPDQPLSRHFHLRKQHS